MKSILALTVLATIAFAERLPFSVENRIGNGLVAVPNQFPYQVALRIVKKMEPSGIEGTSLCGGSLISDDVVLTAAHCLDKAERAQVFLGALDISKADEPGRIIIQVGPEHMVISDTYDRVTAENDIALIKLPSRVPLSSNIQTINLPRLSDKDKNLVSMVGVISGWGRMGDSQGLSPVLRYAKRTIMREKFCEFYFFGFKPSTICVDGRDLTSACPGDSGGPLAITETDGSRTLVGLTSYGRIEGCEKGYPSVYTKVSQYLGWIAANTNIQLRE